MTKTSAAYVSQSSGVQAIAKHGSTYAKVGVELVRGSSLLGSALASDCSIRSLSSLVALAPHVHLMVHFDLNLRSFATGPSQGSFK
jgi:hypothetical protein